MYIVWLHESKITNNFESIDPLTILTTGKKLIKSVENFQIFSKIWWYLTTYYIILLFN